jgi:hypothetical protein
MPCSRFAGMLSQRVSRMLAKREDVRKFIARHQDTNPTRKRAIPAALVHSKKNPSLALRVRFRYRTLPADCPLDPFPVQVIESACAEKQANCEGKLAWRFT